MKEEKQRIIERIKIVNFTLFIFTLLFTLLLLSLALNIYLFSIKRIEVPILYQPRYSELINKTLLLEYQARANIICSVNNFGVGKIVVDNNLDDVYIACIDSNNRIKILNLTYAEILGVPSLITR